MNRHHRVPGVPGVPAVLPSAIGLLFSAFAQATPLVTVRVTSINDALRDIETISASAHGSVKRQQMLAELAEALGVQDLSFLDLTRPAALAIPQEGMMLGANGFVLAIPVRDGATALDVLGKQFAERSLEGDLTVLRQAPIAG